MTDAVAAAARYATDAAGATAVQLLAALGPLVAVGLVVHVLAGAVARRACALVGRPAYLLLLGSAGTVLHEGAHALACVLFRHRIDEIVWFDPRSAGGALGHVRHRWDQRSVYQRAGNFFIGLAPLLLGVAVLALGARLLFGAAAAAPSVADAAALVRPGDWRFWAFLYLTLCVGGAMRLSVSDLRGAGAGLVVLAALVFVVNLCTLWTLDLTPSLLATAAQAYALPVAALLLVAPLHAAAWLALLLAERGVRAVR